MGGDPGGMQPICSHRTEGRRRNGRWNARWQSAQRRNARGGGIPGGMPRRLNGRRNAEGRAARRPMMMGAFGRGHGDSRRNAAVGMRQKPPARRVERERSFCFVLLPSVTKSITRGCNRNRIAWHTKEQMLNSPSCHDPRRECLIHA